MNRIAINYIKFCLNIPCALDFAATVSLDSKAGALCGWSDTTLASRLWKYSEDILATHYKKINVLIISSNCIAKSLRGNLPLVSYLHF